MDLQEASRKISAAEKKKAQLELMDKQNKEEAAVLKKDLEAAGVPAEQLEGKILELEGKIEGGITKIDKLMGAAEPESAFI